MKIYENYNVEDLRQRMFAYRMTHGMTLAAFAQKANLSPTTVCHFEQGHDMSRRTIFKIEQAIKEG